MDFIGDGPLDDVGRAALGVWGGDLHTEPLAAPAHFVQLRDAFPDPWRSSVEGTILEIGCGSGTDAVHLARLHASVSILAMDIGSNVEELDVKFEAQANLQFFRANALRVPIRNDMITMVYSFGVFHHTSDPSACIREAHRVLRPGGTMFLYLYSAHEDNLLKYAGTAIESLLMRLLSDTPASMRGFALRAISLPCLVLFSWPARLLKYCGMGRLASKFPMHWGSTPASILPDLKDRLLAPVNHRFTKRKLGSLLASAGFREVRVSKSSAGLFCYCAK